MKGLWACDRTFLHGPPARAAGQTRCIARCCCLDLTLDCCAQHVLLARSAGEPETYLVNDTADPLQRSLTSLELSDVLIGAPPPGASATFAPPAGMGPGPWGSSGERL